jgi:hypothetical protein
MAPNRLNVILSQLVSYTKQTSRQSDKYTVQYVRKAQSSVSVLQSLNISVPTDVTFYDLFTRLYLFTALEGLQRCL